ncbi:MAG: tRNA (adenosine(37)-N6)-threonylcarbamoyltransferase complex ATPase subunit type 1 TsaE [Firmicutes bacterium]|nr:tRNA (adenosine(37)-N6)-threonylcarbamoyltransferase complex ATPase subunit type 1 TsaE [Bacillota bacterium]MDY3092331.1 tRNA (adenosine(37)-N6)-threonylcarbamoyltransferase complex ATPase subunit type 1 TsaE [Erysipelotrichaceae bacterium]
MKYITRSMNETIDFGYKIGKILPASSVLALRGDLAAGKTTFTKGIGKALNVKGVVNSPTFNILKIYEGDKTLYHIDAYRLMDNPYDLGFEEYIDDGGVMVVEWFDYIIEMIGNEYLEIVFTYIDENTREIELIAHGDKYEDVIKELEIC